VRRVEIEAVGFDVMVYGPDEKGAYERHADSVKDDRNGEFCDGHLWVGVRDRWICIHEAIHAADYIIEDHLGLKGDSWETTELRAYLACFIAKAVVEYVDGV
jgi:hypothetical protein